MTSDDRLATHYRQRESLEPLAVVPPEWFAEFRIDHTGYFETNILNRGHRRYYRIKDHGYLETPRDAGFSFSQFLILGK